MPVSSPFKAPTPTGASATAEAPVESPPTAAPGGTAGQGGDGDPGGDSASPAADPAAEPPADGGSAEVPDGDTAEALAAPSETKNTLGDEILGSPVGKKDENSDDNDDAEPVEPVRKAPVQPAALLKRRASSRVKGEPAPEPGPLATAGAKKGPRAPNGGESAAAGAARASGADVLADEDEEASSDREDDDQDESVAAGGLALLASGAAAIDENYKKNQHPPGVWGTRSSTGLLLAKERVAKIDHEDGKPWEVEVMSFVEDPGGGNDVVNAQSVPRLDEQKSRALITVSFQARKLHFPNTIFGKRARESAPKRG